MASGNLKKSRSSLQLPPGRWSRLLGHWRRGEVRARCYAALALGALLWLATMGWQPPFPFRSRFVPARDITSRVEFDVRDEQATRRAQEEARRNSLCYYTHDPRPLDALQQALRDRVFLVLSAPAYEKLDQAVWLEFFAAPAPNEPAVPPEQLAQAYERFRAGLVNDEHLKKLGRGVEVAFSDFRRHGLLENLEHALDEGSQTELLVHLAGEEQTATRVDVSRVRLGEATEAFRQRLADELRQAQMQNDSSQEVAGRIYDWLRPRLRKTLTYNRQRSAEAAEKAALDVGEKKYTYRQGDKLVGVLGGQALAETQLGLLRHEHEAFVRSLTWGDFAARSAANWGMYAALSLLCGFLLTRHQPQVARDAGKFGLLLGMVLLTVGSAWWLAHDGWRAELIPMLLMACIAALVYRVEFALALSASAAFVIAASTGLGLLQFVVLLAPSTVAILLLGRVRTRTHLLYVGLAVAAVAFATTWGMSTLSGQPLETPLLIDAAWHAFCACASALLLTGLLPFVEYVFDVQTDLRLLELGDASHPLLLELARRAPGTYNHSINVASLGEAAAEAIGAHALLVRVGAYFHDIGKMLKPGYFIENQGSDGNRHQSLAPEMSTLVIIAHVKDGADLARQHRLPQSIIDFIEQHHGTTVVEFFYRQAARRSEENPGGGLVHEGHFRYPGPKPRSKEAAVMMLADVVESASRTLVDPTPARIRGLVESLAARRLEDGQFDECQLTLKEIHAIEESLIKSLTAVYHSRVKYPSAQPA